MHKFFTIILLFTNLIGFAQIESKSYLNEINIDSLISYVYTLSSDKMAGREIGTNGNNIAADYIVSIFKKLEIDSLNFNGYFQKFYVTTDTVETIVKYKYTIDSFNKNSLQAHNIIAFIEGTKYKKETIIVSAHYDHLGKKNDSTIYFGADDNASGVATIIEIARVMQIAAKNGIKPNRNIMFIAFDGEEKGRLGSKFFLNNIPDKTGSIILNINLDMIGRNRYDENKYNKSVFLVRNGKNSGFYKRLMLKINKSNQNLFVSKYPLPFSNIALKSFSDHYTFIKKGIPFVHLQTGMHRDYHTVNDTPDKVNYDKLLEISKLLYHFIWEVDNTKKELKVKLKI